MKEIWRAKTRPAARRENQYFWRDIRITVLMDGLVRFEKGSTTDKATQRVWFRDMPPVPYTVHEGETECTIQLPGVAICLDQELEHFTCTWKDQSCLQDLPVLPGTCRTLDCCDGEWHLNFGKGAPTAEKIELTDAVVSAQGYTILDDSDSLLLEEDGTLTPREKNGKDLYIFAFGHRYREALKALYGLCGPTPVIPKYALGNWWSRYHAYTAEEYLDLMHSFLERNIPFTVATVDMDWHPAHDLPGDEDGWTGYSWNKDLFPDYRAFLKALKDMQLHITLNLHPALGVRWFEDQYEEMARRMHLDPATRKSIAFDMTDPDFVEAYFEVLHHPYEEDGVDFWWIDWQQGTRSRVPGLDPLWLLNHYHYLDNSRKGDGLILSRYAGIGSHRYPLGFSGDTSITWDTLRSMPKFTASASNAGYTWWSHDIGGHQMGYKDDELYVRFIQFGVFSPINRLHSTCLDLLSKDPSAYHGGKGEIAERYLRLRHKLIPLLYTAGLRTHEEGLPLIEPMYYEWPEEREAYRCEGQYLFCQQMICAPVTEHTREGGMAIKKVWLPEGEWTDVFTGDTYRGGRWVTMARYLDTFPLLARPGTFFILDDTWPENCEAVNRIAGPKALRVGVFSGEGRYILREDPGKTVFEMHREGVWDTVSFEMDSTVRDITLDLKNVYDGEVTVTCDGAPFPFTCRHMGTTQVVLRACEPGKHFEVRVRERKSEQEKWTERLKHVFVGLEMDNREKQTRFEELSRATREAEYMARLQLWTMPETWKIRLMELMPEGEMEEHAHP